MKVLGSGSDGNCIILTDNNGNELMLDCGLRYEIIASKCNLQKLNAILCTHHHL